MPKEKLSVAALLALTAHACAFTLPGAPAVALFPAGVQLRAGGRLPLGVAAADSGARQRPRTRARPGSPELRAADGGGGESEDWRQFRAKLVAQEKGVAVSGEEGSGWAYSSGNLVEQGSLLLGGSELEFGFGLRQQYFHKCVMLVLSHTPEFTRGVIVNRPTNRRTAKGWRIWYGGDVQGITAAAHMQEAVCLHKSTNKAVRAVSDTIITGTYTCSLEAAELMVEQGHATPEDFWLLFGYAGWAAGQLQMEIDARASWHVAAASPVLLHELIALASASKTADAGIEVWESLMAKIGMKDKADKLVGSFEDRMLREWAREHVTKDPLVVQSEALQALMSAATRRLQRGFCMYVYTHARTHIHTRKYSRTHARTHTHTHVCVCTHTHTRKYSRTCARTHTNLCTHTHTHTHQHTHTNTHTHAHTHRRIWHTSRDAAAHVSLIAIRARTAVLAQGHPPGDSGQFRRNRRGDSQPPNPERGECYHVQSGTYPPPPPHMTCMYSSSYDMIVSSSSHDIHMNAITYNQAASAGMTGVRRRLISFGGEYDAGSNRVMWLCSAPPAIGLAVCMYVCMCIYIYTYIHTCIIYIHIYICIYIYVYISSSTSSTY
jgi:putative AlgH/UPF0301 family transcriptional regulator